MARASYTPDLDPNHQTLEGIKDALCGHSKRARTTREAVDKIDLEDATDQSLDKKIEFICSALQCAAEHVDDEIVFTLK